MTLHFEDLIDRFHYGEMSKGELIFFMLALSVDEKLQEEFEWYLKMRFFISLL